MWPFKPAPLLDPETRAWMGAAGTWVIHTFGGKRQILETPLVLPTEKFFDAGTSADHARAERLFRQVKTHAGMDDWPCILESQPESPELQVGEVTALRVHASDPGGTFSTEGSGEDQQAVITYNPADLVNPIALIATFAHELGHYLIADRQSAPPGGWELHEPATDYLAVFMGFGIFLANSKFEFSQYTDTMSQGWQYRRRGCLSEAELIYALAQFLSLKGMADAEARPFLKGHLRGMLRKALAELDNDPEWSKIGATS